MPSRAHRSLLCRFFARPRSRPTRGSGRVSLLACAVGTLFLLAGAARADGPRCLPPSAGQVVSALVERGELARAAPEGWTFQSADIDRDRLVIAFRTGPEETVRIALLDLEAEAGPDHGRWFSYSPIAEPVALTTLQRRGLLQVAAAVDGAFERSPWIVCHPRGPGQQDDDLLSAIPWSWMLTGGLFGLLLALLLSLDRTAPALQRAAAWIDRHPWPLLMAMLVPMAAARLLHLDIPFDGDYATQRVFFASLDLGDILAHHYDDARHPQLFYVVLHFFLRFGHAEWITRLPAVLFSLTTAVALFLFSRPILGGLRALVAVGLLGLSVPFLFHSRDVSDVTLFLTLALLSSHLLVRSLRSPTPGVLTGLVLAETAMLYSYYMAVLIAGAHALVLLVHGRQARLKGVWIAAAVAALLSVPALIDFFRVFAGDQETRQVASLYPQHLWGDRQPGEFLAELMGLLAPAGLAGMLWGLLGIAGAVRLCLFRRSRPEGLLILALLGMAVGVVLVGVFVVRLKPYYLIYLLPLAALLVVAGGLGLGASSGPVSRIGPVWRKVGLFALCLTLAGQAAEFHRSLPAIYNRNDHALYERLAETVAAAGGPDTVITDPNSLHTILLYYLFPEPLSAYRTCSRDESDAISCRHQGRRLFSLTSMPRMRPGWKSLSLANLRRHTGEPFWFVYTDHFANQDLLDHLAGSCQARGKWDHLQLFRCEPDGRAPEQPTPRDPAGNGALPEAGQGQAAPAVEVEEPGGQDIMHQQSDFGAGPGTVPP